MTAVRPGVTFLCNLIAMGVPNALVVASGTSVSDYNDGHVVLMLHPIQWTSASK